MTNVGVYARISEDPNDTRAGVDRQRADGSKVAGVRGWTVTREYIDNDLSAFKRKVIRPAFEEMLADLTAGKIDGIVAYDLDRFVRQPRDLERAIDIYDERKGLVFATVEGDIDLQGSGGRAMARVLVAFANKSSQDTGRRVARKHLETAKTGRPVGGFRPFGWEADKATLHPVESVLVREAVRELLAGASLRSIVRFWNEEGVRTTAGKEWQHQTLRQYLRNPRLVGLRTHQREVLMGDDGKPVQGLWEPMLSPEEHAQVLAVLASPEGRTRVPRKGARHYLLTGLVRCGVCQGPMYGNRRDATYHYYACNEGGASKHSLGVSGVGVDELVTAAVLKRVSEEDLDATPVVWEGEAEMADIQDRMDEVMAAFGARTISVNVMVKAMADLEARQVEMQKGRVQWLRRTTGPALTAVSPEEWEEWGRDKQRAFIEKVVTAVIVRPSTKRGNRLDPERVEIAWREL